MTVLALIATLLPSLRSHAATPNFSASLLQTPVEASKEDSHRLSFVFGTPRRYATRYLAATRTLQLRVTPAKSEEFQPAEFYDGKFVHRVIIKESNGEVFINLQLKNQPTDWVVTHQENPWRILVDLWHRQPTNAGTQNPPPEWEWSGFFASSNTRVAAPSAGALGSESTGTAALDLPFGTDTNTDADSVIERLPGTASGATPAGTGALGSKELKETSAPLSGSTPVANRSTPASISSVSASGDSTSAPGLLGRFLRIEMGPVRPESENPGANGPRAEELFLRGEHEAALNAYRRMAGLAQREFVTDPKSLWYAAEAALQVNKIDVATDYLLTLKASNPGSIYVHYATLRLLDLEQNQGTTTSANQRAVAARATSEVLAGRYLSLAREPGAPAMARAMASLRALELKPVESNENAASLIPSLESCLSEARLVASVKRNCAYQILKVKLRSDDLIQGQKSIKAFETSWPGDSRIAEEKKALERRMSERLDGTKTPESVLAWNAIEKNSSPEWLAFSNTNPEQLRKRAQGWERSENPQQALALYERAAEVQTEPRAQLNLLAKAANLAQKSNNASRANRSLTQIQSHPDRPSAGLGAEDYALVREIALPPYNNSTALKLVLDDIFKGFHAENDIRTLVTLAERLEGSREADFLFEKLLAIPSRSAAEAELKEDALLNYAETLRNQGRLVKSADTFLAVANLDNGKNRAEAAYKAGVVYFRAGLLEKATSSWNIAANDLENSKYSALATERLNRIR